MIDYKQTAKNVIDLLRSKRIPAWLMGGVAVDILGDLDRWHKDIDIYIKDYSYQPLTRITLIGAGFRINRVDGMNREFYIDKNNNVGLDIFYGSLFFGRHIPKELDYDSYVVDLGALKDSLEEKLIRTKVEYETVMTNLDIVNKAIEKRQGKAKNIQKGLNIIK